MKRFYVNPDYIDTTNPRYNIVEPEQDTVPNHAGNDYGSTYDEGEQVSVEIVTESGNWESLAAIRHVFEDEYGVLLSVEVDWGQAVLLPSDA